MEAQTADTTFALHTYEHMMYLRIVIPINLLEAADEISRGLVEVFVPLRDAKQCYMNFLQTMEHIYLSLGLARPMMHTTKNVDGAMETPKKLDMNKWQMNCSITTPETSRMVVLWSTWRLAEMEHAGNLTAKALSNSLTWYWTYRSMLVTCNSLVVSMEPSFSM
jgi:hypothetical protein